MAKHYTDITVASIAANSHEMSFSSDTGMAECLIIGRKTAPDEKPKGRGTFISLRRRPFGFGEAKEFSAAILAASAARRLEDGPYGGIRIFCGDNIAGETIEVPVDGERNGWNAARILDASVAQTAHALSGGDLWLPGAAKAKPLTVARLGSLGNRGVDHQLLVSAAHKGPFIKSPANPTATYPALYNHHARNERYMVCAPDMELVVNPGMEESATKLWATASRAHLTLDFRFTSQPLAAAITEQKTIGGTAWPNVAFNDERHDYAFALWCNSTLGLLLYWWWSSKQQDGRGRTTIHAMVSLPMLDLRALSATSSLPRLRLSSTTSATGNSCPPISPTPTPIAPCSTAA